MIESESRRPSAGEARVLFGAASLLVICAGALSWVLLGSPSLGIDDAYITFVYGRHLAQGLGFVFIPGGEHVEGMTSMAWALISGAVLRLTEQPELPLMLLSAGLLVPTIGNAHRALRAVTGDRNGPQQRVLLLILVFLWAACQPGIFAWNVVTLMESSLWTFLVTYAAAVLSESCATERASLGVAEHFGLATCAAAMALTRPESLAVVPVMWSLAALVTARSFGVPVAARRYLPSFAAFVLASVALVGFRLHYFGYPYPNTYYAKSTPHRLYALWRGFGYALKFFAHRPWNAAAVAALMLAVWSSLKSFLKGELLGSERALLVVSGTILFFLAIPMFTGGDPFGEFRFYQPIVLLLIVPVAYLLIKHLPPADPLEPFRRGTRRVWVPLLAASAVSGTWYAFSTNNELTGEFTAATVGRRVGQSLTRTLSKTEKVLPTLGVIGAGGLAWGYDGPVLDLLGLNWTRMAHSNADRRGIRVGHGAFSAEVFWSQPPDFLVLDLQGGGECDRQTPVLAVQTWIVKTWLRGVTESPRFAEQFEAGCLGQGSASVAGFFSKTWLHARPGLDYHPLVP
ncbi:MAG TPA: hypothetical protein VGC79_21250 [Polyangiaceae bacterium]